VEIKFIVYVISILKWDMEHPVVIKTVQFHFGNSEHNCCNNLILICPLFSLTNGIKPFIFCAVTECHRYVTSTAALYLGSSRVESWPVGLLS
jgi:hypothetical protein